MFARRSIYTLLVVCTVAAAVCSTAVAEGVLDVIPGQALGFVVVNRLDETDAAIVEFAEECELPAISPLGLLLLQSGVSEGIDRQGAAAMVFLPGEDTDPEPIVLVYVPVTDFGQFVEQLDAENPKGKMVKIQFFGSDSLAAQRDGYAVIAERKHRAVLKSVLKSENRLADDLADWETWIDEHAAAAVITRPGIRLLASTAHKGLREMRETFERMGQEENPAIAIFGAYGDLFDLGAKEVLAAGIGLRIDESGVLHVVGRKQFKPDGAVAAVINQIDPVAGGPLAGLPSGPFVMAGGGAISPAMTQAMMGFGLEMMKSMKEMYGLDEDQIDRMIELAQPTTEGLQGMAMVMGIGQPDEPLYAAMAAVMRVDDTSEYVEKYRAYIKGVTEMLADSEGSFMSDMTVEEITIDGKPGFVTEMGMPITPGLADIPEMAAMQEAMMEKMFGPGGRVRIYFLVADEHTLVMSYVNPRQAERALAVVAGDAKGLADDATLVETAAMLSDEAQWVGYWSPGGTVTFVNQTMAALMPAGMGFTLPEFPESPPVAVSLQAGSSEMHSDLVISPELVRAISAYVAQLQQAFSGMGGPTL